MKLSKEVKTAIIVIAGIAAFFVGFNFLKSKSIFRKTNTYYAYFPHSGGLKTGTQITVNGVKVGSVEAVDLEEKTAKIKITMECSDDFSFSKNSVAELYNSLLGGAGLQIIPAFDNAPVAVSGDVLEARIQEDMLASISSSIKPTQEKLNHLLNHANKITTDLAKVSGELSEAELNKVIADAQTTLNNLNTLLADIEGGKGTIGKLMKDEALYKDLDKSTKQLELLLQDFRLNPKRYVHFSIFGKKAKVYEPQDEEKSE